MFDIGWDEMALVAVVALIVIGPKDLPGVLRTCGQWVRKARQLAGEFQRGVDDMVREAELHDLKHQVERVADTNALKAEIEKTIDSDGAIARSLEAPALPPVTAPQPEPQPPIAAKPVPEQTMPEPKRPPEP